MILFQIKIYKKYMILHDYFEYIVQWATTSYEKRRPRVWDVWSLSDLMHYHIFTAYWRSVAEISMRFICSVVIYYLQ